MAQVQQEAAAYWWLRAGLAPIALLNMAINGILQVTHGFHHSCIGIFMKQSPMNVLRMFHWGYTVPADSCCCETLIAA